MPENNHSREQTFRAHAEPEMAAFLRAAAGVVGQNGLERAGNIWLQELESLDRAEENIARLLRRVTINAISHLVSEHRPQVCDETLTHTQDAGWMNILVASR